VRGGDPTTYKLREAISHELLTVARGDLGHRASGHHTAVGIDDRAMQSAYAPQLKARQPGARKVPRPWTVRIKAPGRRHGHTREQ
jgi:ribosomal protein L20